tara:strand:+ start:306 stop:1622 length:1317 start_codon:yes stop_codon:yes gene_type:complete
MSTIKVNTVETRTGSTLTLGKSGDTVSIASGASTSGMGRTGTVDWQTTPKTANFTATNGEGYFINTTSGAVTMTMPSGSAGSIVSIQDYNKTFDSNAFTVSPASGQKLNGGTADGDLIITTEGQGLTFVYVDSTVGWKTIHENEFISGGSNFITASGGTITNTPTCRIHTFTSPGTFTVSALAATPANNAVGYLVVAGGGAGGRAIGGGGGAGGFREGRTNPVTPYTASPLVTTGHTVSVQSYPITVGSGGSSSTPTPGDGGDGSDSVFSSFTSAGGGGGAGNTRCGPDGGSGGGAGALRTGGTGNTPPVSPAQGTNGGNGGPTNSNPVGAGGGGGATAVGGNGSFPAAPGNNGGAGGTTHITGSPVAYAGGGGGANQNSTPQPSGGTGGGGKGGMCSTGTCMAGAANTGGGGGGAATGPVDAGNGGSGIVIIRYKIA